MEQPLESFWGILKNPNRRGVAPWTAETPANPGKGRARINAPKTRPGGTRASFGGVFTRAALAWAASLGA